MEKSYVYEPGMFDYIDPKVLVGHQIKFGSIVTITKSNIDPLKKFVFIEDKHGNRQSVYKSSLKPTTNEKGTNND